MAVKYEYLPLVIFTLVIVVPSEDAPKRRYHDVTFDKYLKDAVALTVDTFNKIGSARDDKIYDVVKLQIAVKRLDKDSWTYDRLDMALSETNCTKVNATSLENCVIVNDPVCVSNIESCKESTDRTIGSKKQLFFGSSFAKNQEAKFDKYLQDAVALAVDTFNKIGNVKEGKLYDVVSVKATVKRIDTDIWIYDRLQITLRETNCTKTENLTSPHGCVVIVDNQPDQSCRYQVSTGQINGSQILGCTGIKDARRR